MKNRSSKQRSRFLKSVSSTVGRRGAVASATLEALEQRALFSTVVWSGGGADNNWATAANWAGGVAPVSGDSLQFTGSTRTTANDNYTAGTSFGSIEFASPGFTLTGNQASLTGGITVDSTAGSATVSMPIALAAAQSINVVSGTMTLSGAVSGSGALTKSGSGTLTFTGANTNSGGTDVSAGTLAVFPPGTTNTLGSGAVSVDSGATLALNTSGNAVTFANTFSGTGTVTFASTAQVSLTGGDWSGFSGYIDVNTTAGGKLAAGTVTPNSAATITVGSGSTFFASGAATFSNLFTVTGTGNTENRGAIRLDSGATISGSVSMLGNSTVGVTTGTGTISGPILGSYALSTASTSPGTLVLSGSNSYTGGTIATSGTVNVSGDQSAANGGWTIGNALASTAVTVSFLSGSTVAVASGDAIQVAQSAASASPATLNVAGTVTDTGALIVARAATLNINSGASWIQNGSLSIAPSSNTSYNTSATLNTGGTFNYAGSSAITLAPSTGSSTGRGLLSIAGGTFITDQPFADNVASGGGAADLYLSNSGMLKLSADVAPITSTTGSPFNVQISSGTGTINTNGHNGTINQPIIGSGLLNKGGTGVLTLTGSSTYSGGATIAAGAILAENSAALGTGTVTISNGGTSTASLQLAGGINLANSFAGFNSEVAGSTPTFENISGNNTISSNLSITGTGGNGVIFQSDAGLFTLSGTLTTTLTTTRTYIFQGTGNGVVTGSIADDASDILRVVKTGTGTWTLTGTNSYADGTTINAGTLSATGLAVSGAVSATSTGTFSNMSIAGAPWTDTDIGAPSLAGAATFNTANTYTVAGSGSDITGAHDQLNFVSQPFVGDGGITAEVNGSPVNTDSTTTTGSKDGIMFRDDLLADGSFVEIGYTTGSGIQLLYRDGNGATVQVGGTASSITGAVWLSLNRVQGTYTASYSTDGSTFTTLGTVTTENIGENAFVGMLVSSHDNTKTATATFSNVAITTSLVASTTEADLAFTVPWLSSSDTLVYADDGSGWEMVADAPAGTSSVALTSLTADESYSIELASATAVVAAGGTTTGNTPPALTTADSTLAPTDTDVTLYQVIADSSLSEGISSATDTGSVVVAHEYVYADDEIEAAGLAGITVTNFESNGHADGNFDGGVVEAGNTGHTAPDNEPSLAELLGIDNSTPILAVEDGTDGDFNDAFANLTIVEL